MTPDTPPNMPAAYLRELLALAQRWDVTAAELLEGTGLAPEDLTRSSTRIALADLETIAARAIARTGEPGIAFLMGLQMRISSHGFLGFAAMTARTLGEALALAERFAPTRNTAITMRTRVEGDLASILLDLDLPAGPLREQVAVMVFVGLGEIASAITGRRLDARVEFDFPRPGYWDRFEPRVAHAIAFERAQSRILLPASALELPLVAADPAAMQLALEQCERELAALGRTSHPVERVRRTLRDDTDPVFGLDAVAKRLGTSPRTLKRRLAEHGLTFSELLDEHRRERALLLLADPRTSIEAIAEQLGYSNAANFTRAFKRWTGRTPAAHRARG